MLSCTRHPYVIWYDLVTLGFYAHSSNIDGCCCTGSALVVLRNCLLAKRSMADRRRSFSAVALVLRKGLRIAEKTSNAES